MNAYVRYLICDQCHSELFDVNGFNSMKVACMDRNCENFNRICSRPLIELVPTGEWLTDAELNQQFGIVIE